MSELPIVLERNIELLPVDEHPVAVYLAGLQSEGSRRVMRSRLSQVVAWVNAQMNSQYDLYTFPWQTLRLQHLNLLRSWLAQTYKPTTANATLAALRGVLKAAWRLKLVSTDDYLQAVDVDSIRGETVAKGRELTSGELGALLGACAQDKTPAGRRDAALIALLYSGGLRRAEAVTLDLTDWERTADRLRVCGKGNKERLVYLVTGAKLALADWLTVRGEASGPLFYRILKGGSVVPERLTTQAIYVILKKRAVEARVPDFSPHDLRRTFVSDLLEEGVDIVTVQKMAGHANVQTTSRYDRRPETAKRQAAEKLHVPYKSYSEE